MVAFGLLVLYPVLGAQFVLVDDHEIISLTPPIGSSIAPAIDVRGMALESDPSVGRFRPLYWTVRLDEVMAFGANPRAWHATVVGLGLLSAGLLFGAARTLGASVLEAGMLGAWLLVAPGVSSLWVRLGADDTLATAFLCLSLFACARAARSGSALWDVVFVVAAAATFLSKEAFALTALALAGLRVFAGRRKLTWSAVAVLALGIAETVIVFLIGARAGPLSYGGRYLAVPALGVYARSVVQNAAILAFAAMGWLGLLVGARRLYRRPEGSQGAARPTTPSRRPAQPKQGPSRGASREMEKGSVYARSEKPAQQSSSQGVGRWPWLLGTLLMVVLVGPQLVLYSQQGIFEGKYEAAAAVGVAGWSMLGLVLLRHACSTHLHRAGLAAWAVVVALFGFSTWTYANAFTQDSLQLARMVDAVSSTAAPGGTVGIAADAARQYEPIESLADHIAHRGRGDLELRVLPLAPSRPYSPLEASFAQALAGSKFEQPPLSDCAGVSHVIVLGDEQQTLEALPCLQSGFARVDFSSNVLLWGGDQVSMRPRVPGLARVGYLVYQRTQ